MCVILRLKQCEDIHILNLCKLESEKNVYNKSSAILNSNMYCNMPNISNAMAAGLLHVNISDHNGHFVSIITPHFPKDCFDTYNKF